MEDGQGVQGRRMGCSRLKMGGVEEGRRMKGGWAVEGEFAMDRRLWDRLQSVFENHVPRAHLLADSSPLLPDWDSQVLRTNHRPSPRQYLVSRLVPGDLGRPLLGRALLHVGLENNVSKMLDKAGVKWTYRATRKRWILIIANKNKVGISNANESRPERALQNDQLDRYHKQNIDLLSFIGTFSNINV